MIRSVNIERLRGIGTGLLDGLAPLTVFVGPNASGKSTVLDALLIGAHPIPEDAIGRAVRRRANVVQGVRWLFQGDGEAASAVVTLTTGEEKERRLELHLDGRAEGAGASRQDHPWSCTGVVRGSGVPGTQQAVSVRFADDNHYRYQRKLPMHLPEAPNVCLVDPSDGWTKPLHALYSEAKKRSGYTPTAMIQSVLPGCREVEILTDGSVPSLYLVFDDHSLPVAACGGGIQRLVRTALELSARRRGLVLLEEPETHLHPAAIGQVSRAIWAAVRHGIQVVLTTHSLELIDRLVDHAKDDDLERLALFRTRLDEGVLKSSRLGGEDVRFARQEIEDDLR